MFYFLSITIYYNHLKLNKDILIKLYHIKIHNLKNPFGNLLFNFYKSFIIFFYLCFLTSTFSKSLYSTSKRSNKF